MKWLPWVRNGGTKPQFLLKFCVWHGEVYLPSWLWQSTSRGADLMIREGKHSISWSQDLSSTQLQKYSHQCLQYKEPIKSPSILIYLIQFWLLKCYWLLLFESPSSAMPPRNRARYHKGLRCAWLHRAQVGVAKTLGTKWTNNLFIWCMKGTLWTLTIHCLQCLGKAKHMHRFHDYILEYIII